MKHQQCNPSQTLSQVRSSALPSSLPSVKTSSLAPTTHSCPDAGEATYQPPKYNYNYTYN